VNSKSCRNGLKHSGVAGASGARAPERRPWGRISTFLLSFKNAF